MLQRFAVPGLVLIITGILFFTLVYVNQEDEIPEEDNIIDEEKREAETEDEMEEEEPEVQEENKGDTEIESPQEYESERSEDIKEYTEEDLKEPEADMEDLREIMERQAKSYPETFFVEGPETDRIALTFDDGPDELNTPEILDILADKGVKVTFFVLGENVKLFPEVVERIVNEGHEIGNHSWTHINFREADNEKVLTEEIYKTSEKIEEVAGEYPRLLRPPFGAINDETIEILGEKNWDIVNWSIDSYDWHISRDRPDEIIGRMERLHHPGGIVLLHNNFRSRVTVEALPGILDTLQKKGYEFTTVSELLN